MAGGFGELAGESQGAAQTDPNIAEVGSAGRKAARKHKKEREATKGPAMQVMDDIHAEMSNGEHGAAAEPAEPAEPAQVHYQNTICHNLVACTCKH